MSTTTTSNRSVSSAVSSVTSDVSTSPSSSANTATSQASTSSAISSASSGSSSSSLSSSAVSSAARSSAVSSSSSTQSSSSTSSAVSSSSSAQSSSSLISSTAATSSSITSKATSTATVTGGSVISSSNDGTASVSKSGLSGGAIGGIVGGIVGVLALCVLTWLLVRWRRRRRDVERYPLPAPRPDMVFSGKPDAVKEERPAIPKGRGHESFNSLYAPSLPSYYPNYNRPISSMPSGLNAEPWSPPQPQYMSSTTTSTPSTPPRSLQQMSSQSSMALTNAISTSGQALPDSQDRPLPAPIQTTGLAPPASVDNGVQNMSRRSSRSTMMFPNMPHSPSVNSMHSNGFGNTPHSGRRITLTMPTPLDPSTAPDGYLPRADSISEFGQYTSMYGGSPSTTRRTRDSRRSLQPYHQGHLSPHIPSATSELSSIPGAMAPISGVSLHQHQGSISTITAPSSGPSRNGSGSAGSTSGGATSDSEALMIRTAKGKQVDRTS